MGQSNIVFVPEKISLLLPKHSNPKLKQSNIHFQSIKKSSFLLREQSKIGAHNELSEKEKLQNNVDKVPSLVARKRWNYDMQPGLKTRYYCYHVFVLNMGNSLVLKILHKKVSPIPLPDLVFNFTSGRRVGET